MKDETPKIGFLKKNKEFLKKNPSCSFIEREILILELLKKLGY